MRTNTFLAAFLTMSGPPTPDPNPANDVISFPFLP